jgi:ribosomal protein S18 acetylase RimI-like enzyme
MTDDIIRPLRRDDLAVAQALIAAVDLFPSEMLPEMAAPWLDGREDAFWLTAEGGAGLAYAVPERLTEGTWNLLLLAVAPARQGQGLGRRLVAKVEQAIGGAGARLLLVETSGEPSFMRQRRFYSRLGFRREARIRDYYQAGTDKVIFAKTLGR